MKYLLPFVLLLVIAGGGGGGFLWWQQVIQPPTSDPNPQPFIITPGQSATRIGEQLARQGFIRSSLAFQLYVKLTNQQTTIRAGDYRLTKNLPLGQLVGELTRGPIAIWITLQEGLRREEIGQKMTRGLGIGGTSRQVFLTDFARLTKNREGFLFPDTYLFMRTASAGAVIDKLTATFDQKIEQSFLDQATEHDLDKTKLITLASLVERETRTNQERPIVAGILLKRWRAGWPLQADATLQYATGSQRCTAIDQDCQWWKPVTRADKKINSRYNTYTHPGLPPGPIANPGLSSIKAAANPQDSDYWFYLHDNEGKIHYAKTVEEHQQNIQKYLQ